MTGIGDYEEILMVIEKGIDVARRKPKAGEPIATDDYSAWRTFFILVFQRAMWKLVKHKPVEKVE